jgi:hypothetical protein
MRNPSGVAGLGQLLRTSERVTTAVVVAPDASVTEGGVADDVRLAAGPI